MWGEGTWGPPSTPKHGGGHPTVGLGSRTRGGAQRQPPPQPLLQVSPKRSWGWGGGFQCSPPLLPSIAQIWGGGGRISARPPPPPSNQVPVLCRGGGVTSRGGGEPGGGAFPPPLVHHVTTRLTLDTDTKVGCAPPNSSPPPRRTLPSPPHVCAPRGEVGAPGGFGGVSPPPRWGRGWGGGGTGPGGGGGRPRYRCGLRVT